MRRLFPTFVALAIVATACSSGGPEATPTTASVVPEGPTTIVTVPQPVVPVSAANGGVVSFGDDVVLVIPPGALAEDTVIEISAIPESEWPDELTGLVDASVAGDFLRLEPDGLEFSEPATLWRRVAGLADLSDDEVSVRPILVMSRSGAAWEALSPTVDLSDREAVIATPIDHFSENVAIFSTEGAFVTTTLTSINVKRFVGQHFISKVVVHARLGELTENFWNAKFTVISGPLRLGQPSNYRVQFLTRVEELDLILPGDEGPEVLVAPMDTPNPTRFPAAYNCTAVGKARFGATFGFEITTLETILAGEAAGFGIDPDDLPAIRVKGDLRGAAECVENPTDISPGLVDIVASVSKDTAGHSCCVKKPPRRARMTLGSLWFTDAKLGGSTDWQGLFFDTDPGRSDDVMNPANDSSTTPPNTVEIVLADDFEESGKFSSEGVGTVAGFSGIRVRLEAAASSDGTWAGTLTMGVDGGLPTGEAIVYEISGTLIAPQPIQFVEDLAAAFRAGDSEFLLEHLHPDVLALYGPACVDFTEGLASPDLSIAVHSIDDVLDWDLELDGNALLIQDALRLDVTRTEGGTSARTEMHVAPRPGDGPPSEMTWFVDCGDPFPRA